MKKREAEPEHIEPVELKSVFGIPPTTYVPAVLGVVLAVILFFLLVYPGIRNNGSVVRVETVPEGASVEVDGTRVGHTPLEVFVERGTSTVTLRRPFFEEQELTLDVPGRLFGSLFFPKRMDVESELEVSDPEALTQQAARDFNSWALVGEANAQYQFPPVLSTAVLDLSGADADRSHTKTLLDHAVRDVHSEALLKDYLRALALDEGNGGAMTGLQALGALGRIADLIADNPGLAYAVRRALPDGLAQAFETESWYETTTEDYITTALAATEEGGHEVPQTDRVEVAGQTFIEIPGREYVMGMQGGEDGENDGGLVRPHVVEVDRFYIMQTEVSRSLFYEFVRDRPEWGPSARSELVESGRATGDYLRDWDDGSDVAESSRPVHNVSYYAAAAFTEWLEERLPSELADFEVRLPREAEWEWATLLNASEGYDAVFAEAAMSTPLPVGTSHPGKLGIHDLLGNVWEWTSDWYHRGDYLVDGEPHFEGSQRVVRGGSWANERRSVTTTTRGSQPPAWSTPFLGFRPVIVEGGE
ncbi:MAG: SUMF1/EgtB/PvdO family nonheme iron enzyme [Spirochaetota bacterium]